MNETLKYAFAGTGYFAAKCLETLARWKAPSFVATSPSAVAGRGKKISRSPVGEFVSGAMAGIPLIESPDISRDPRVLEMKHDFGVDFTFVTDFGQFIREPLLSEAERVGCLNIHPSALPLYRGAAPIQRALMDGACEIGVSVFKLSRGMDAGPVLLMERLEVGPEENFMSVRDRAAELGGRAFAEFAARTPVEFWNFVPQNDAEATTYAHKITEDEERIDWNRTTAEIANLVRALSPKPGAWTTMAGRRLTVLAARPSGGENGETPHAAAGSLRLGRGTPAVACGDGFLELITVLPEGRRPQPGESWKNGSRARAEERLI
ncbi:MAG: methionyl-tRNA formyltransferase [Synergistaceae bacterium]|jgi:methionyl-tRNA formyltransferase|nr:methionyl-tRNA formyltransferase [Synergistaceae bacterium]